MTRPDISELAMIEIDIERPGVPTRTVRLRGGVYGIGRQESNPIFLEDKEVSRQHARLLVDGDAVVVEDLGSGNGTHVDGARVERVAVGAGSVIEITPFTLRVRVPQAAPEPTARLDGVRGVVEGQSYPLTGDALTIGRADDQDIRIFDPGTSRRHARVQREGASWVLRDGGASNGVFVNDNRIVEAVLQQGDVIRVGLSELRFVDEAASKPAGPPASQRGSQGQDPPAPEAGPAVGAAERGNFAAGVLAVAFVALLAVVLFIAAISTAAMSVFVVEGPDLPEAASQEASEPAAADADADKEEPSR